MTMETSWNGSLNNTKINNNHNNRFSVFFFPSFFPLISFLLFFSRVFSALVYERRVMGGNNNGNNRNSHDREWVATGGAAGNKKTCPRHVYSKNENACQQVFPACVPARVTAAHCGPALLLGSCLPVGRVLVLICCLSFYCSCSVSFSVPPSCSCRWSCFCFLVLLYRPPLWSQVSLSGHYQDPSEISR